MAVRGNIFRGLLLSDFLSPPHYLFGPPAKNGKVTEKMPSSDKRHMAVLDLMMWIYFLMVIERCFLLSQQLYSILPSQLDFLFLAWLHNCHHWRLTVAIFQVDCIMFSCCSLAPLSPIWIYFLFSWWIYLNLELCCPEAMLYRPWKMLSQDWLLKLLEDSQQRTLLTHFDFSDLPCHVIRTFNSYLQNVYLNDTD